MENAIDDNTSLEYVVVENRRPVMSVRKKLKLGDVVQLTLSSSPRMTVVGYGKDGCVECCWGESEKLKQRSFPQQSLDQLCQSERN